MNQDGSVNLAPMSSAWWLGLTGVLGLGTRSKTYTNLQREGECVLNLPSVDCVAAVDRLALTTWSTVLSENQQRMGYRHVRDKFAEAELTAGPSDIVRPSRVMECPIQLEAEVTKVHAIGAIDEYSASIEVHILRVHVEEELIDAEFRHHISPERWRPLIMNFLDFYGLGDRVHSSRLAEVF
jgi:flavin reductase (DIM6/NTAB) family NADH-FMN oxidoreductase RutF